MSTVPAEPQPFQLESDGLTLVGNRWGPADPDLTVLLLHGGGQTRHTWRRTAAKLGAAGYGALSMDARGHGDSDWAPDSDYALEAFARDLTRLIGAIGGPVVVVGASLGGLTALRAAADWPRELIRGLVLVDVVIDNEPRGVERILSFMRAHTDGFATIDEAVEAVAAYNPTRKGPADPRGLMRNLREREDGRLRWHWDPAFLEMTMGGEVGLARLRANARGLEIPVMLVRGGKSDVVSDAGIAALREVIPHAQLADVAPAGHMVVGDDNDAFLGGLEAFLSSTARR